MTIQARCKVIADKLLEIYKTGKNFSNSQEFNAEYLNWLNKLQKFYDEEVDDETELYFSIEGNCLSGVCGDIEDVLEFCDISIKDRTTQYHKNIMDILYFYIQVFSKKKMDD